MPSSSYTNSKYVVPAVKYLDPLNIDLIKALYKHGPSNLSEIARSIGASKRTIHSRFSKLKKRNILRIRALARYNMLGLVPVYAFISTRHEYNIKLLNFLKEFDYTREISLCLGTISGFFVNFVIPVVRVKEFEELMILLVESNLVKQYKLYYLSDIESFLPNFNYFNPSTNYWFFDLEQFAQEMKTYGFSRITFSEPDSYEINADDIDVFIVCELENDATTRLARIAKALNVSRALVKYHYDFHVYGRLIKGYHIDFPYFSQNTYVKMIVRLTFNKQIELEKFAYLVSRTPFVRLLCKELRKNSLLMKAEFFSNLAIEFFYYIIKEFGNEFTINDIECYIIDERNYFEKPLPKELFRKEKGWNFRIVYYEDKIKGLCKN